MSIATSVKPNPTIKDINTVDVDSAKNAESLKEAKDQKDMFLKLLVAQLSNQDPSSPMDQKDMMAQMSQFTQVEQLTNMVTAMKDLGTTTALGQSIGLIGKSVSYEAPTPDGMSTQMVTAKVTGITNGSTGVTLQLDNNASIKATDVKRVTETAAST